jgi:hypothetical protein
MPCYKKVSPFGQLKFAAQFGHLGMRGGETPMLRLTAILRSCLVRLDTKGDSPVEFSRFSSSPSTAHHFVYEYNMGTLSPSL